MWNAAKQSTKNLFILWRCSWLFSTSKFNFCLTVIISWFISFLMWSWRRLSKTKFERGNLCDSGRRLFLNNKLKRKINFIKNQLLWMAILKNKQANYIWKSRQFIYEIFNWRQTQHSYIIYFGQYGHILTLLYVIFEEDEFRKQKVNVCVCWFHWKILLYSRLYSGHKEKLPVH